MSSVFRRFADFPEGQVNYREAAPPIARPQSAHPRNEESKNPRPLIMLHASPGSSLMLQPLIAELGENRWVVAPDTLGNGDSRAPVSEQPAIPDYADAVIVLMNQLGIRKADFYGTHTGARMATYIALTYPDRVHKVILDGFGIYTPNDLDEILKTYAPAIEPDQIGSHVMWAWHFCRDQFIYFPWFRKDKEHRVPLDLPDAQYLHEKFVEILKSIQTYHKSYRAAFRYSMAENVPGITQPAMITFAETDMVRPVFESASKLLPGAHCVVLPGIRDQESTVKTAAEINRFLDL